MSFYEIYKSKLNNQFYLKIRSKDTTSGIFLNIADKYTYTISYSELALWIDDTDIHLY